MTDGAVVVVGGTGELGRDIAQRYADRGHPVVISGRDAACSDVAEPTRHSYRFERDWDYLAEQLSERE